MTYIDPIERALIEAEVPTTKLEILYRRGDEKAYYFAVPGEEAEGIWYRLRDLVEQTGHWPVILGNSVVDIEQVRYDADENRHGATESLIEKALKVSGSDLLEATYQSNIQFHEKEVAKWKRKNIYPEDTAEFEKELAKPEPYRCMPIGKWDENAFPNMGFVSIYDYRTNLPHPTLYMGMIPTTISWQVPIHLRMGGWNACPPPHEHGAVLRYWQEKYEAEVVCHRTDTLELTVDSPPITEEESLALAREQYLYCSDIVDQGTGTIHALAGGLLDGETWYFWWD